MNIIKLTMISLGIILFATGCGTTTMTCTLEDKDFDISTNYVMEFDGDDELSSALISISYDVGYEMTEEELKDSCADFDGKEGVICRASAEDTTFILEMEVDREKVNNELLESIDIDSTKLDELISNFEEEEYTCTEN